MDNLNLISTFLIIFLMFGGILIFSGHLSVSKRVEPSNPLNREVGKGIVIIFLGVFIQKSANYMLFNNWLQFIFFLLSLFLILTGIIIFYKSIKAINTLQ
jgi:uncharacterized membrane protein AbrB (regulator of aidB expression)